MKHSRQSRSTAPPSRRLLATANAAKMFQHMEFCHQVLWPELDVQFVSVTDQVINTLVFFSRVSSAVGDLATLLISNKRKAPAQRTLSFTADSFPRLLSVSYSIDCPSFSVLRPACSTAVCGRTCPCRRL